VDREMIGVRLPQSILGSVCIFELWGLKNSKRFEVTSI
jgi:hypothetical protein